jgi:uncharacterized repeat protein (TIGR03803 family)
MHSVATNCRTNGHSNISNLKPRFGSTKLAAAAIHCALTLAVLSALLPIASRPAQAQTETVLHNFTGGSDGAYPNANLTSDGKGNYYGTTPSGGGYGVGTVFELSPNGSGGWNETVLWSFNGTNGSNPSANVIFDSAGNLYGTTPAGGKGNGGVAFELTPIGKRWKITVLYNFVSEDNAVPNTGLVMDSAGNLYGTTEGSNIQHLGSVFQLIPNGNKSTEKVIYYYPRVGPNYAGLTIDAAGNLFGVQNQEKVFELSPNGGTWTATVIHGFTATSKIYGTPVLDPAGNLYGTTMGGGANGFGSVYKLTLGTNGKWTEKVLYSFESGSDGNAPQAGVILDAAGNVYGTTSLGGPDNLGTVFELAVPVGKGSYTEKVLWSFNGTDGSSPYASLILDSAGNLYGTTSAGGSDEAGVAFEVTP